MMNSTLEIDLFAKKPELRLPNGSTRYTSFIGCMCTLVYVAVIVLFGAFTMDELMNNKQTYVSNSVQKDYFEPLVESPLNKVYAENQVRDIQVAFGVTQPGFPMQELNPKIGTIKAYFKSWDYTKDETEASAVFEELKDKKCSIEELGLAAKGSAGDKPATKPEVTEPEVTEPEVTDPVVPPIPEKTTPEDATPPAGTRRLAMWDAEPYRFWQSIDESSRSSLAKYQAQLRCIEQDDKTQTNEMTKLAGNSEHLKGTQLVILFEACSDVTIECYDPSTIRKLIRGKSIVILANQRTFDDKDFENPFFEESKIIWVPFGPEMIEDNFFSLQVGNGEDKKQMLSPFDSENNEGILWQFQRGRTVGYKDMRAKPNVMAAVTIELDLNRYDTIRRVENSFLAWLAMLGGLVVGLYVILYALEYFLTFKSFQNYMASELYYVPEEAEEAALAELGEDQQKSGCCKSKPTDGLTRSRYSISRDFHNEIIPEEGNVLNSSRVASWCKIFRLCFFCCKRRRIERIFAKARVYTAQELNITSIIKAQRESQAALQMIKEKFGQDMAERTINSKVKRVVQMSDDEGSSAAVVSGLKPEQYKIGLGEKSQLNKQSPIKDIENQHDKTNNEKNESNALIEPISGKSEVPSVDENKATLNSKSEPPLDENKKRKKSRGKRGEDGQSPEGDAALGSGGNEEDQDGAKKSKSRSRKHRDETPNGEEEDEEDGKRQKSEAKKRHRRDSREKRDRGGRDEEEDGEKSQRRHNKSRGRRENGDAEDDDGEKRRHKSARRNRHDDGDEDDNKKEERNRKRSRRDRD